MSSSIQIVLGIAMIFGAALAAPWLQRLLGARLGPVLALAPVIMFGLCIKAAPAVASRDALRLDIPWATELGISLSFFIDGFSLLFLLIISAVGTFVVLYAGGYLHGSPTIGRFYLFLLSFMAAMLGIVSADNLILLFVFWELTSITSFLLIGYDHEEEESRKSSLQALLVTGGGGLAMLAGFVLLGHLAGTYRISEILALPSGQLAAEPSFPLVLGLILLGAFTKSAQFPFHFWLPNAMAAPAPVSSFLHSATMVKAGVFLLARLHPCLSEHPLWTPVVGGFGAATMITGVFLGFGQTDLKKILAYTTLSVLGTLTMLLGIGTELSIKACLIYLLAHALYKAALFMTAGAVDHETGTRDINTLSGLRGPMPLTAIGAVIGALSMAGCPILVGFISKEYFYKALLDAEGPPFLWEIAGVSASMVMTALAIIAGIRPYLGTVAKTPKHPHEAPWTMWIGPLVLGGFALKFGILPGWVGDHLITPAARAVLGQADYHAHLKLWDGLNTALLLSLVTVIGGLILYALSRSWREHSGKLYAVLNAMGPQRAYFGILNGTLSFAKWQTSLLQNGKLRNYVLTVGAFTVFLILLVLPRNRFAFDPAAMAPVSLLGVLVCLFIIVAAVATCFVKSRFTAILTLGVVGLGIAMIFFMSSAPDLAMTQVLVETLTVVLFVLAFRNLPLLKDYSSKTIRIRDAVAAGAFGIVMTCLVLVAFQFRNTPSEVAAFHSANSLPAANGRNVVNVILVDFRALDTLGEITVLGVAALGIYAMLRMNPTKP